MLKNDAITYRNHSGKYHRCNHLFIFYRLFSVRSNIMNTRYNLFMSDSNTRYEVKGKHWKAPSEIELKVEHWLDANKIGMSITGGFETKRNEWKCDQWNIGVWKVGQSFIFDTVFYTGIGHRANPYPKSHWMHKNTELKATVPHVAGVLYSLINDAASADESFSSWCDNLGYDSDSISALNTYQECEKTRRNLLKVITNKQLQELQELLQDY